MRGQIVGVLLVWLCATPASAQDHIFSDGFESGDTSAWSDTVGWPDSDLCGSLSGFLPAATYAITCDIEDPSGQTLTLAPGVVYQVDVSPMGTT